ncbi:metalloregulator ArsR/SmtB family transcription factor [Methylotenera sp.]|uniref:ArsR/SmtB family transcription factor n=1 Tax=Methylotenera sp. TaxID=2051956 RepID=UPI0024885E48|nr:metalloregulator ArsR/SmtB family transcription factor [Methylotenera sp.]MDI1360501.1 metalloregulator ArsR/SmtB family transcription factor [Methylotenera sp.]
MDKANLTLDFELMRGNATHASNFLKTLANADRLLLLCQLSQTEMCVSELETATGIKQPTLSQQLTVLRSENLVNTRRDGKQIYYSISSQEALSIMQLLYEQFCKKN